ncbi:hypothetical protein TIFTF001_040455 [Ficus carica]|uniref:Uncharacterized protein n=1 Tax=Ficus carica TaxID=3494 RepID=A0AA88CJC2_FICCA|nr:hypothetical protein TIFTF001_040451 [Ficus carica]GMN23421.1 hypothetical protein TIFTF001_040455 [Ficus carica]
MDGIGYEVNLESGTSAATPTDTDVPIDDDKERSLKLFLKMQPAKPNAKEGLLLLSGHILISFH